MDCFYIITNKLKDKDYAITSQIVRAILFRELFLRKQNADWY